MSLLLGAILSSLLAPTKVDGNHLLILSPASLSQKIQRTMATWGGNPRLRFIILWRSAAAARGLRRDSAYCKAIIHEAESSGECGWAPRRAQVGARGRHTLFESFPLPATGFSAEVVKQLD